MERIFRKLTPDTQQVFIEKMGKAGESLHDYYKSLQHHAHPFSHKASEALQAAKNKRAKKQAKANKQAQSVPSKTAAEAALRAEAAAAELLKEEQAEHEAGLQKARKAAAKRARAQQKKSSAVKPGLQTAQLATDGRPVHNAIL